jgi:hypothetical protein
MPDVGIGSETLLEHDHRATVTRNIWDGHDLENYLGVDCGLGGA